MVTMRKLMLSSTLNKYLKRHKKVIICSSLVFVIGIIVGILSAVRAVEGEFERIPRADMTFGSAKVFFISTLALIGGYVLILIGGHSNKTVVVGIIPFVVTGFFFGQYSCLLIAQYEGTGILNLMLVYMPFFIVSGVSMMLALCNSLSQSGCEGACNSHLKPSFVNLLKICGINVGINFVFIMIIGSIFGVVIVNLY